MFTVYVNGIRVEAEGLQYTCVDPGGFETCSFTVSRAATLILPGYEILVLSRMDIAWQGFVEEPGFRQDEDIATYNVTGVGAGILLKRNSYSMVYLDRDLNRWQGISNARQLSLLATIGPQSFDVVPDTATGAPAILTSVVSPWVAAALPLVEAWYDAGVGNKIGSIQAIWTKSSTVNAADANWSWIVFLSSNDVATTTQSTGNLRATGPGVASITATTDIYRYGLIQQSYGAGPVTTDNTTFSISWTSVQVYGDHGLDVQVLPGLDGIRCTDIANHAFQRAGNGIIAGQIDESPVCVVHSVYYDPVLPEQVVDDMAKYLGWHWGVWEGQGIFDPTPRYYLTRPPSSPTISVNYGDCEQFDVTERFSQMHDKATIQWSDASGQSGVVHVTKPNSRLPDNISQELLISSGIMGEDEAEAYATLLLANDQLESRYAGQVTLPATVTTALGPKDSHMVRPGRDRMQIVGMPLNSTQIGDVLDRTDSFRVSRLSASVENGSIRTQVEFDTGASLLDTLNARLDAVHTLAGG